MFVLNHSQQSIGKPRETVQLRTGTLTPALLALLFFCAALILLVFRINQAPDLFSDEGLYASVGNNLAAGRGLVENSGDLFVWHPPLYPLLEAAYIRATGQVDASPLALLYQLRLINVVAGALTAALLFGLGWRLRGLTGGTVVATLYCLDPYIQRINRRSMLETVGELLLLVGLVLFLRALHTRRHARLAALAGGGALGLAILTKELLALGLLALLLFALLFRRDQIRRVLAMSATALAVYAIYPLGLLAAGYWPAYAAMKNNQLLRIVSRLVPASTPAPNAPPISRSAVGLWESASRTLMPYLFSYLMIALAGVITLVVLARAVAYLRYRMSDTALLLACWALVSYGVIGMIMLFGRGSDQFFYFLAVPATVMVGQALARPLAAGVQELLGMTARLAKPAPSLLTIWKNTLVLGLVAAALGWNIAIYGQLFVRGQDNSYAALTNYVNNTIPAGATIVAGSDLAIYLFPGYHVRFDRTPEDLRRAGARYVILSSKERWGGYNRVSPDFYDWVAAHGAVRFTQSGATFWDLTLYELDPAQPGSE